MSTAAQLGYLGLEVSALGAPIALTLRRHPNDRMISFCGVTPAGLLFELGAAGAPCAAPAPESPPPLNPGSSPG